MEASFLPAQLLDFDEGFKRHHLFSRLNNTDPMMAAPQWQALPVETRRSVTKLMVRLILDHVGGDRTAQQEGADHDA